MPLSEEELRLLEQMEQALAQEDPKFVSTLRGSTLQRAARMRALGAGAVFLLGIVVLMTGAVAQLTWLGIVGFVIMLASATIGLASWRGHNAPAGRSSNATEALFDFDSQQRLGVIDGGRADKPRRPRRQGRQHGGKQGSFMQRMEQRWERRRQQGF